MIYRSEKYDSFIQQASESFLITKNEAKMQLEESAHRGNPDFLLKWPNMLFNNYHPCKLTLT